MSYRHMGSGSTFPYITDLGFGCKRLALSSDHVTPGRNRVIKVFGKRRYITDLGFGCKRLALSSDHVTTSRNSHKGIWEAEVHY